eukprot:1936438-Prymnesium_polylepis.1
MHGKEVAAATDAASATASGRYEAPEIVERTTVRWTAQERGAISGRAATLREQRFVNEQGAKHERCCYGRWPMLSPKAVS